MKPSPASAGPGDAAVRGVEDADLGLLVGLHRIDQLHAHAAPVGAAGCKVVFDHPLDEALTRDRGCVVAPGGGLHARAQFGRRARRDAVDHRVGAGGVRLHPREQIGIARALGELEQPGTETVAVVAQVVAVEQRHRAGIGGSAAGAQDGADRAVDGLAGLAAPGAREVLGQLGGARVEAVLRVEVVAGLGHGEGHDARGWRRAARDHRSQRALPWQHFANGFDLLVAVLGRGRHGFERVAPALRLQCGNHLRHVGADVGPRERPAGVARIDQPLKVDGLVGPVERAESKVKHRELRKSRWSGRKRRCCKGHGNIRKE
jgi:hypothetical protein